jgi:hypothetical protein
MRQRQPASSALDRVKGCGAPTFSVCTTTARSHSSTSDQSMNGTSRVLPISRARKPEQSMKRSPSTSRPFFRTTLATEPSAWVTTSVTMPSVRLTPRASAIAAQELGHQARVDMQGVVGAGDQGALGLERQHELPLVGHHRGRGEVLQARRMAVGLGAQPALIELVRPIGPPMAPNGW